MAVSHFSYRREQFPFTRSSETALLEFNRTCPEWGRRFLKNLKGFGPGLKSVIFPQELSRPQNRALARRIATEPGFLNQFFNEGVLDLRRASPAKKPLYVDRTADFPERKLYEKLRTVLEPQNLEVIRKDHEVGDLALFHSLWQVRVMIYKAQYLKAMLRGGSLGPDVEKEAANHAAESSLGYARRFIAELHSEFPLQTLFGRGEKLGKISTLFACGNLPAIDAVLVFLTESLGDDCDQLEATRLRRERYDQSPLSAGQLAAGVQNLARSKYGVKIGAGGTWEIPQATFKSAGAVLRREQVVSQVDESAVVRRTQHEIDNISAEKLRLEAAIEALKSFSLPQQELEAKLDRSALSQSMEACEQGHVVPKVKARLLIGLATDLLEVAGFAAAIPEMSPSRQRLTKFSCAMLSLASGQLAERNRTLNAQLVRLEVKKRILETLVDQRAQRYVSLTAAADFISSKLLDDDFMERADDLAGLRDKAIAAFKLIQDRESLEAGVAQAYPRLREFIRLTRQLDGMIKRKEALIAAFNQPGSLLINRANQEQVLASLARQNREINEVRLGLVAEASFFGHHVARRFLPDAPDAAAQEALRERISHLTAQWRSALSLEWVQESEGPIYMKDIIRLRLEDVIAVPPSDGKGEN